PEGDAVLHAVARENDDPAAVHLDRTRDGDLSLGGGENPPDTGLEVEQLRRLLELCEHCVEEASGPAIWRHKRRFYRARADLKRTETGCCRCSALAGSDGLAIAQNEVEFQAIIRVPHVRVARIVRAFRKGEGFVVRRAGRFLS